MKGTKDMKKGNCNGKLLKRAPGFRDQRTDLEPGRLFDHLLCRSSPVHGRSDACGIGAFAVMGLFLAAVGIFGIVSYAASLRHREFSIRMALGASHVRWRSSK